MTDDLAGRRLMDVLEAALFVGSKPLSADAVAQAFPGVSSKQFSSAVHGLKRQYELDRRPYRIAKRHDGYILEMIEPFKAELVDRIRSQHQVKLNRAAIDVLSVVAYRQPIEKTQIDELLSLDTAGTLRQLVRRGLLLVEKSDSAPASYVTSKRFLELFGLDSLADLPSSEDLERL